MALNLSPETGVKLTKKDRAHVYETRLESNLHDSGLYI